MASSTTSGNFTGCAVSKIIAACNANDVVTRYLSSEKYEIQKAIATVSNAMDVGNPSNFVRILEILENNFPALTQGLSSYSINDTITKATIIRKILNRLDLPNFILLSILIFI